MQKDREKLYQAYHTMLSMALTWALVLVINQNFTLKVPIILTAVYSFIPALIIYAFDLNKKNVVSYIILGSILPLLALAFWITKFNPFNWLRQVIDWCRVYNGSEELYQVGYANITVICIAVVGAILFYLLMKKRLVEIVSAAVILIALITLCVTKISVNKIVVAICIFYILTIIVELCGTIYSKKAGKQEKKESILYLAPICLLLAVISISLPSKPEPIQWQVVKNAYHNMKEQIELWKTDLDYYFGQKGSEFFINTGFSEDGSSLNNDGKKLKKDNKVALEVTGIGKDKSLYLIGSISNVYTGNSWEKNHKDYLSGEKDYVLDYTELFYSLSRLDQKVLVDNRFVDNTAVRINYNYIKTKTFFYPMKTKKNVFFSKSRRLSEEAAQVTFSKPQGKGTCYETTYYDLNLQGDAFVQMLRDADSFSYQNKLSVNKEASDWVRKNLLYYDSLIDLFGDEDTYQKLAERAKLIKDQDTKLPEELPDRVRKLAQDITADYDNTYDKLKAIEEYLNTYKYSLHPPMVPKGEDFIDYFLFESQEGYCTSFATAMAVLGRCIGVPTRYVEGFVVKPSSKDRNNVYHVKNSQAHAWAEAYIEGVGWIPFEATAPYYKSRYNKWADIGKNNAGGSVPSMYDFMKNAQNQKTSTAKLIKPVVVKKDHSIAVLNGVAIFFAAILSLLLTVIIYYNILRYRYKKIYNKANNSRKMYMLFLRILRLLKREGFELEQQETILMLSKRVKDNYIFDSITFRDVTSIYMRYRYAEEEVTTKELAKVNTFYLGLSRNEKEGSGIVKVWLRELIFLAKRGNR